MTLRNNIMPTKDSLTAPYVAGNDTTEKCSSYKKLLSIFNLSTIAARSTLIVGLSGGPDSVYLLHRLVHLRESLGLTLVAAHLDHEWRDTSKDDVIFCEKLCAQLNIPFITKKGSELKGSFSANGSQEQLGRNMRRFFLEQVREEHNATAIALAHHQDDQLETFFINLIRGTTITGLCGMKEREGFFLRPLLQIHKQEILSYLAEHKIPYQTDPTNESDAYLRNRIRMNLIPAFIACDTRASNNLTRGINHLREAEQFLQNLTTQALYKVTTNSESTLLLNLTPFFALDTYLQKRVLSLWLSTVTHSACRSSEAFLDEVLRFLQSPRGGSHHISQSWCIIKKQNTGVLQKINSFSRSKTSP
jgi:tRNA(Ile)-lysidine synthase